VISGLLNSLLDIAGGETDVQCSLVVWDGPMISQEQIHNDNGMGTHGWGFGLVIWIASSITNNHI
jgi:hypothetical protein